MRYATRWCVNIAVGMLAASAAFGGAIVSGFNTTSDGRNDDGTYTAPSGCTNGVNGGTCAGSLVPVGFNLNFFGVTSNSIYINTNGNVTLDAPLSTFTPFGLTATTRQIIAPFFADVDTRNPSSGVVTFGTGTFDGRNAFGVNWINVGYFNSKVDKTNSFQLLLVDRTDTGPGNFDIVFNYDQIQWETGDASNGVNGLGGSSARVGFSNGTGNPGTSFELAGSAIPGALIDGGPNALITHDLNSNVLGRYIFNARNGQIIVTPEPTSLALLSIGGVLLWCGRRSWRASR
ncbi:MAG TPA: nidogen-like domain-containing protein [Bryobacteraceae bacterium]|nr:nidogen-like domain-containing protein [Bryobacteraceae bacterium]